MYTFTYNVSSLQKIEVIIFKIVARGGLRPGGQTPTLILDLCTYAIIEYRIVDPI